MQKFFLIYWISVGSIEGNHFGFLRVVPFGYLLLLVNGITGILGSITCHLVSLRPPTPAAGWGQRDTAKWLACFQLAIKKKKDTASIQDLGLPPTLLQIHSCV